MVLVRTLKYIFAPRSSSSSCPASRASSTPFAAPADSLESNVCSSGDGKPSEPEASKRTSTKRQRRKKLGAPVYIQVLSFTAIALVAMYIVYTYSGDFRESFLEWNERRKLRSALCSRGDDEGSEICAIPANPAGLIVLYIMGALYLFVAIAIVCDEFFVPALEEIGMQWDISDDVAGATLMAAGGSAPELATSLIGTFQGSDVGFGTIVGSAVFNVLFVISCCVIFTPKEFAPLELTAWPLARDCSYYIVTLIFVAVMFGINSPGIIEAWEASFLFALYLGYCVLMAYNETLYQHFVGKKIDSESTKEEQRGRAQSLCFPSRYRAGFMHMITQGSSFLDTAGVNVVFKIKGDVKTVFDQIDVDKSGTLDASEIKKLLIMLHEDEYKAIHTQDDAAASASAAAAAAATDAEGVLGSDAAALSAEKAALANPGGAAPAAGPDATVQHVIPPGADITDEEVAVVMRELDLDQNGLIDFSEFTVWYVKSEQRLYHEEKMIFEEMDPDNQGSVHVSKLGQLLSRLQAHKHAHPELLEEAKERFSGAENGRITWEEFHEWFRDTEFWKEKKHDAEVAAESAEGIWGDVLDFPKEDWQSNLIYILLAPITLTLACTCGIKDVRVPGNENWCYFQFVMSILWIGGYSWLLVDWITITGATLGIPAVVMGLTFLAAGTSVPDLLSSVVVAKQGKGDMAVSSSIGSNIFDVTVGLPVPWMLFNAVMNCPVVVGADNLFLSLVVLLGMVLCVILSIMASSWKMSHGLGAVMMLLYIIFLGQDVIRVYLFSDVNC